MLAVCFAAGAQPLLHLKTRTLDSSRLPEQNWSARRRNPTRTHLLLEFSKPPGTTQIQALEQAGARVVNYIPDQGLMVSVPEGIDLRDSGLRWYGAMQPMEKISPMVSAIRIAEGPSDFLVEFHPDVSNADARALVLETGLTLRDHPDLLAHHVMVSARVEDLGRLAAWDEVAYIFPASAELSQGRPLAACAGAVTAQGAVAQYVTRVGEGWDGPGRNAADLGYYFRALTSQLPADSVRSETLRALNEWARHVQVNFRQAASATASRSIAFLFASGSHGDGYPFDGRGRVLGHTFYPSPPNSESLAGDMHLDADETWRIGADIDVFSVVLHEAGHALGLGHSDLPGAVMYPYYRRAAALNAEDIAAIRELYAARTSTPAPGTPTTPTPPTPPPPTPPTPPPAAPDRIAPTLAITYPASTNVATSSSSIVLRGTARDNVAVTSVTWSTSNRTAGLAAGTTEWTTPALPLLLGTNLITVKAADAAGNSSWRTVAVTRTK